MRAIEKIKEILREMQEHRELYVQNPKVDFTRSRKVTFFVMRWFLLFIGANSVAEEIRRAFNYKNFSFISEAAIFKSWSKIKLSAFQYLLKKFNDSIENLKTYRGYDGLKMLEHCNRIPNISYLIRLRREMNLEIGNLPDKTLDIDMEFEVCEISKRQPYKMKIKAWDMEKPCFVKFRLVKFLKNNHWIVFATNLSREDFSSDDLKELYGKRWKIAT